MKNKLLLVTLMSASVCMQAMENDSAFKLKAAVAVAGVAVTGIGLWRMTAPSDAVVLHDINQSIADKKLAKYNQTFDVVSKSGEQETQLETNLLNKLEHLDVYQQPSTIQMKLDIDGWALRDLKDGIWFRSFFNSDVSKKHADLANAQANAEKLKPYFKQHDNFFKGWNLVKEHIDFAAKAQTDGDWIRCIRKTYVGDKSYPLIYVAAKYLQDIKWIKDIKKGLYPKLDYELVSVRATAEDSVVWLQAHPEYEKEQRLELAHREDKRQQDLVDAQLMNAKSQLLAAQAASEQAQVAAQNVKLEQQRLSIEKDRNERERLNYRATELQRQGYSQRQIQQQLDNEGFTKALISLFFGK